MILALCKFGIHLEEHVHMIIPPLLNLFNSIDHSMEIRQAAMETIAQLSYTLDFTDFASRIICEVV